MVKFIQHPEQRLIGQILLHLYSVLPVDVLPALWTL